MFHFEQFHAKFCKLTLGINKFASNYAIRAELGRYPIEIYTNCKLIKYWHRLENLSEEQNSILLADAYYVCKNNNHKWSSDIRDFLNRNGMNEIYENVHSYKESFIANTLKCKLEEQYIQKWDQKSKNSSKLCTMFSLKSNNYKCSSYLNEPICMLMIEGS